MGKTDTDVNRRRLAAYVDVVRRELRMGGWDIVLHSDFVEPEAEAHAETWCNDNHHILNIRLAEGFFDLGPAGIRNTIIHELVHAQHRDVTRLLERIDQNHLPPSSTEMEDISVHMERFVAWVTDRLEDYVPMWDPKAVPPSKLPQGTYLHSHHI